MSRKSFKLSSLLLMQKFCWNNVKESVWEREVEEEKALIETVELLQLALFSL